MTIQREINQMQDTGPVMDFSEIPRSAGMTPEVIERIGRQPFLLRPGHFAVIDGDTIKVFANPIPEQTASSPRNYDQAFSLRFRSIAAPEKQRRRATDAILTAANIDPYRNSPGRKATALLKEYLDQRALLVQPTGRTDKFGRMLCDMAVVPYTGMSPDLNRAMSLERLLLSMKVVNPFEEEMPPGLHPQGLEPGGARASVGP